MANAIYRKVAIKIWSDRKFRALSQARASGQYLWLYMLINRNTSPIPGLFCAGQASMAEDLGWRKKAFEKCFAELRERSMVRFDEQKHLVWLPNSIRYNLPESPNVILSWGKYADFLPECRLKDAALARIYAAVHELDKKSGKNSYTSAFVQAFGDKYADIWEQMKKGEFVYDDYQNNDDVSDNESGFPDLKLVHNPEKFLTPEEALKQAYEEGYKYGYQKAIAEQEKTDGTTDVTPAHDTDTEASAYDTDPEAFADMQQNNPGIHESVHVTPAFDPDLDFDMDMDMDTEYETQQQNNPGIHESVHVTPAFDPDLDFDIDIDMDTEETQQQNNPGMHESVHVTPAFDPDMDFDVDTEYETQQQNKPGMHASLYVTDPDTGIIYKMDPDTGMAYETDQDTDTGIDMDEETQETFSSGVTSVYERDLEKEVAFEAWENELLFGDSETDDEEALKKDLCP